MKGLWERRPEWWPADVSFMDPNNRKRTKTESGIRSKKPTKDDLLPVLKYLVQLCRVTVSYVSA